MHNNIDESNTVIGFIMTVIFALIGTFLQNVEISIRIIAYLVSITIGLITIVKNRESIKEWIKEIKNGKS